MQAKIATKWYRYTRLNTDGTREEICRRNVPMSVDQMRNGLGCDVLQLIPREYYEGKEWATPGCQVYGDDEGRVDGYQRNQHFTTLTPEPSSPAFIIALGPNMAWDVPGDCIMVDRVEAP